MQRIPRQIIGFFVIAALMLSGSLTLFTPTPTTAQQQPLTVWHALPQAEADFIAKYNDEYSEENGIQIEVQRFGSEAELRDALLSVSGTDRVPDVYLGSHQLGRDMLEVGISNAYCRPGECPEVCQQSNPPRFCQMIAGEIGQVDLVDEFILGETYCMPDQCQECQGANPPHWCIYASGEFAGMIDLFHVLPTTIPGDDRFPPFPYGIIVNWDHLGVMANPRVIEELGIQSPRNFDELIEVASEHGIYFDGSPVPMPFDGHPVPFPAQRLIEEVPHLDDIREAPFIMGKASDYRRLREATGEDLQSLVLDGLRLPMVTTGAFATMQGNSNTTALDYVYYLAYPDEQITIFEMTGRLPAHNPGLAELRDSEPYVDALVRAGANGILVSYLQPGDEANQDQGDDNQTADQQQQPGALHIDPVVHPRFAEPNGTEPITFVIAVNGDQGPVDGLTQDNFDIEAPLVAPGGCLVAIDTIIAHHPGVYGVDVMPDPDITGCTWLDGTYTFSIHITSEVGDGSAVAQLTLGN